MPSDREIRVQKEEKLFDVYKTKKLLEAGMMPEALAFLVDVEERTHSGMTAEEIDAVKERVHRTMKGVDC
jgi:hypothetical protein